MPFLDKRKRQKIISGDEMKQKEHELLTKIFNATKHCSNDELPRLLDIIRGDASIEQIGQYVQDHLETTQYGYDRSTDSDGPPEDEVEKESVTHEILETPQSFR
jgi:hypothetical protein